jgi:perosamine synthetase
MTAAAVIHAGAIPVFADVDPETFCLSPEALLEKMTPATRAVIPVPIFGLSCEMDKLMEIAQEHDLFVVEDCAQSLLSSFKGKYAGTWGHMGAFSFEQSKHICSGDGGMLLTDDEHLAGWARKYSDHGASCVSAEDGRWMGAPYSEMIGYNYRLPELCAAVALAQLERIESIIESRRQVARLFGQAINETDWLIPQRIPEKANHTYYIYPVLFMEEKAPVKRDRFQTILSETGIKCKWQPWEKLAYMEPALTNGHLPAYMDYALPWISYKRGLCPVAEAIHPNLVVFPVNYPARTEPIQQAEKLTEAIKKAEGRQWI